MARENITLDGLRERIAVAFALWKARRPSGQNRQEDFGAEVVRRGGRDVSQNAVSRWLSGSIARDLETMTAIALALEVDPGWLYFAPHSEAPAPSLERSKPVATHREQLREPAPPQPSLGRTKVDTSKATPTRKRA